MSSLINLYSLKFNNSEKLPLASTIITIIVLSAITVAVILIFVKVRQVTKNLNDDSIKSFKAQYSTLIDSLRDTKSKRLIYFWSPLYLLRWFLTLGILLVLRGHPSI